MYTKELTYFKRRNNDGYDEKPEGGHFSLCQNVRKNPVGVRRSAMWYHCREDFDRVFPKRSRQFLFHNDNKGENIYRFIKQAEKKLKVEPLSEILGFKNVQNVTCVRPSKWWTQNATRRQLFTILLRCGIDYENDFNDALHSQEYIQCTREATKKFFNGYTHCTLRMAGPDGWVSNFDKEYFEEEFDGDMYSDGYHEKLEKAWRERLDRLQKPKEELAETFKGGE